MRIAVLGPLEVHDGVRPIDISGTRLRVLLTVLALEAPRAVSISALTTAIWSDEPPADEANALQSLVSRLRKALGDADLVQQSAAGYRLTVEPADIDLHRFERLARDGHIRLTAGDPAAARDLLLEALALWRGEPVDLAAADHGRAALARIDERRVDARADLIAAHLALGEAADVIADIEELVAAYPMRERFAGLQIEALYAAGRSAQALATYERVRARLADELGVDPSAELQAIHLRVLRGEPSPSASPHTEPAAATATPAAEVTRHNLRSTLTSFVGRDEQLKMIAELLGTGRLITLVGPGGAGKTRLASEAANNVAIETTSHVWLIELAPVTDPGDVPQTVLGALGLREAVLLERTSTTARDTTTRLIDALSTRTAVMVLDNCEHLIDAAAQLADQLLAHCPDLRVIATSREPLGIFGESLVVVPPLGQPRLDATAIDAMDFPAVRLFADRAADVQPNFAVDDHTVAAVIEIVRRLDGQPLAIELAAARLRTLPVAEIARRLSDRFRLLTGGSRTAMPRHRTLRAVVEWSWDLLSEPERLLAERLAVFSGGVTPDAAAVVCAGDDLDAGDVDELLTSLVEKSLLQVVANGTSAHAKARPGPRYRMLETIREFGLERMAERSEVGRIRQAHADYFAAVVEEADPHLRRAEQIEWIELLNIERDNILAGLKFYADDGQAQAAIDLVVLLGWHWMTVGSHGEIVTWVGLALDIDGDVKPADRLMAEAFYAINAIAWEAHGNSTEIEIGMERLKVISQRMTEVGPESHKLMILLAPIVAMFVGDVEQVDGLTEQALLHEDPWIAAAVRTFRASVAENKGDVENMRRDAEMSLVVFRELGERWGMANSLQALGQLEMVEGNLDAAAAAYREALELADSIGANEDSAMMRMRLAETLARLGDTAAALVEAEKGREAAAMAGSPLEVIFTHIVQVEMVRASGDLAAASALRDEAVARLRQLPDIHPIQSHGLAIVLTTAAKIDIDRDDVASARAHLAEALDMAIKTTDMPVVAAVAVAVAMLAERLGQSSDAAVILGAAAKLRGADDATQLDIVALTEKLGSLTDGPLAADYAAGRSLSRDEALVRIDPAALD